MRVYLAGPMRGIEAFNFPTFAEATAALRRKGHTVFSPAERDLDAGFDPTGMTGNEDLSEHGFDLREALGIDIGWICTHADAVAVLPGWAKSSGARAEVAAAWALGVPVYRAHAMVTDRLVSQERNRIRSQRDVFSDGYDADHRFVDVGIWTKLDPELDRSVARPFSAYAEEWAPEPEKIDGAEMVTSSTGGTKGRKLERYDLIPVGPLAAVAHHYGVGAAKYEDRNWERGFDWSLSYAALHRHLAAFWSGTEIDDDPTLAAPSLHLAAVVFHAFALLQFSAEDRYAEFDDRPASIGHAA